MKIPVDAYNARNLQRRTPRGASDRAPAPVDVIVIYRRRARVVEPMRIEERELERPRGFAPALVRRQVAAELGAVRREWRR